MEWLEDLGLMQGFVIGAIAAVIGAIIELFVTSMTLQDNLDSKSGWRKELFEVASKSVVNTKSVNTLRATLRYEAKKEAVHYWVPLKKFIVRSFLFFVFYLILDWFLIFRAGKNFWELLGEKIDSIFFSGTTISSINLVFLLLLLFICMLTIWNGVKAWSRLNDTEKLNCCGKKVTVPKDIEDNIKNKENIIVTNLVKYFSVEKEISLSELEKKIYEIPLKQREIDVFPLYFFNFDSMTRTIIDFCENLNELTLEMNENYEQEKVRIYCRYMLKHHWENLSVPSYRFIKKFEVRVNNNNDIRNTIKEIIDLDKKATGEIGLNKIPVRMWKKVINEANENYPISDKFIKDGYGQEGGYKTKSGNNEKEHILMFLGANYEDTDMYSCSRLKCKELLLYLAEAWKVDSKKIEVFSDLAKIKESEINIAPLIMKEIYTIYQELNERSSLVQSEED